MSRLRMLAAAALVSLVALASAPAHAGDGQRALGLLPRDMSLVASWNVARSRLSPVGGQFVDILADGNIISGTVQRLRKSMGLDWSRDVDTVVVCLGAEGSAAGLLVVLIEGRVDQQKLVAAAQKDRGFRGLIHRGVDYYQSGKAEIAFLDGYWVTVRRGAMPGIIDVSRGQSASARSNKSLTDLLQSVNVGTDLWCVASVPKEMRGELAAKTGSWTLNTVTASMDLKKRVRARVRLGLTDQDAVIAVGAWVRTRGPTNETIQAMGLSTAVRGVSLSRRDDSLTLTLTLAEEEMVTLKRYLRELAAERAAGNGSGS